MDSTVYAVRIPATPDYHTVNEESMNLTFILCSYRLDSLLALPLKMSTYWQSGYSFFAKNMSKRMFSTEIINSDPFLEMPPTTQMLYIHLSMHADDDGFLYPKKVMRMVNANEDDLKILISKKFVLYFDTGVIVVKHWKVNNYIRNDRYRPTTHRDEYTKLHLDKGNVYRLDTTGIPSGSISRELDREIERGELSLENTKEQIRKNFTKM